MTTYQMDLFSKRPYNNHAAFAKGSRTSMLAAAKATHSRTNVHKRILDCYDNIGPMTADTCARYLGLHFMYVRPRCTELTKEGYLTVDKTIDGMSALGNPQAVLIRTLKHRATELQ